MQRQPIFPSKLLSAVDLLVLMGIGAIIYGLVSVGQLWRSDYTPAIAIDLSLSALPRYMLFSATRGIVAYVLSLLFTLVVGYAAAKSRRAEMVLIPMLDILQSVPLSAFLPGLFLGMIALFPHSNVGLELAAITAIFTSQVWNMSFAYYASIKAVPDDLKQAAQTMGLSAWQRLLRLELPFSAVNLAWNSLVSMAGGWFFLSLCESFRLGDQEFRLPGVGAYIAEATAQGDARAIGYGIAAMTIIILVMDLLVWRPILAWVQRFRLDEMAGPAPTEPLIRIVIRDSRLVQWAKQAYRRAILARLERLVDSQAFREAWQRSLQPIREGMRSASKAAEQFERGPHGLGALAEHRSDRVRWYSPRSPVRNFLEAALLGALLTLLAIGCWKLFGIFSQIPGKQWILIVRNTLWTLLRVTGALVVSSLWAVPAGLWIGTSSRRIRLFQPIIQVLASFPAPMIYPLVLTGFLGIGIDFSWGSMFLMAVGVQWYILFNVLAGALRIPKELRYAMALMKASRLEKWKKLYLPCVFPTLIGGWVMAAGGSWNASIVAEYVSFGGTTYTTGGLGAMVRHATDTADFPLLAASVSVMVAIVVLLNRTLWASLYRLAERRYRLES